MCGASLIFCMPPPLLAAVAHHGLLAVYPLACPTSRASCLHPPPGTTRGEAEAIAIATPIKTLEEIRREREAVTWSLGDDEAPAPRVYGALRTLLLHLPWHTLS